MPQLLGKILEGAKPEISSAPVATQQTAPRDIPALPVTPETVGFMGSGIIGMILTILFLRRKTSRDKLEILKDGTEGLMLKTALEEKDKAMADARQAWSSKTDDARLIGQLTAENDYLKRELKVALEQLAEIRKGVQAVGQKVDRTKTDLDTASRNVSSGFTPLE